MAEETRGRPLSYRQLDGSPAEEGRQSGDGDPRSVEQRLETSAVDELISELPGRDGRDFRLPGYRSLI